MSSWACIFDIYDKCLLVENKRTCSMYPQHSLPHHCCTLWQTSACLSTLFPSVSMSTSCLTAFDPSPFSSMFLSVLFFFFLNLMRSQFHLSIFIFSSAFFSFATFTSISVINCIFFPANISRFFCSCRFTRISVINFFDSWTAVYCSVVARLRGLSLPNCLFIVRASVPHSSLEYITCDHLNVVYV